MTFKHKNLCFVFFLLLRLSCYAQNNYFFDSSNVQINPLNINTEEAEFGPYKIGSKLYFTSSKEVKIGAINLDESTQHQLLDLYSGIFTDSVTVKKIRSVSNKINNSLNQGACFFDKIDSKLYYSTDVCMPSKGVIKKCKLAIYSSQLKNQEFETPKVELILPDTCSVSHPMIYNHKLYFSSNMLGGKGKTDIYTADKIDEEWTNFKNLSEINTEYNEFFPFVINENEIYFTSNKPGGFGELDIYKYTKQDSLGSVIQNIGGPINSSSDDFGIYIDTLEENGYFSTNRIKNQDDIFFFSKSWPSFNNCKEYVKEDYCYNLSEESTLNTDSLKGYYYEWLFGDGTKQKGLEVRHCFLEPGSYLINLNVVDSTTKAVFMTQATFDLKVDSIEQLKINCLDTVCVNKTFAINTIGTYLPYKNITGYYYEIENKKIRGNTINYEFKETGIYQLKLGITYTSPNSSKKQVMCSTRNIVVVDPKTWASVEKREITDEIVKFSYGLDSAALKNLNEDEIALAFKELGLNGKEVSAGVKNYLDNKTKAGNKPVEITGSSTIFSLKDKYNMAGIDTIFDLKEAEGVTFKVHLGTSKTVKDTSVISANGIVGIKEQLINGEYHYTVGEEKKIDDIEKIYRNSVNLGIRYPIVIAYQNGLMMKDQSKSIFPANFYEDKKFLLPKPTASINPVIDPVAVKAESNTNDTLNKNVPNESVKDTSIAVNSKTTNTVTPENLPQNEGLTKNLNNEGTAINDLTKALKTDSLANNSENKNNLASKTPSNSVTPDEKNESQTISNKQIDKKEQEIKLNKDTLLANEIENRNNDRENNNANSRFNNSREEKAKTEELKKKEEIVQNKKTEENLNNNEYVEDGGPEDSNNEVSNTANEINEAIKAGSGFVPKTKIQRKIMLYLKKFGNISAKDLEFKVQVGVFKHRKRYHFPKLKGLGEIDNESMDDGLTRMTIGGSFKTLKEAFVLNKKVVDAGQEDAFVSVYYKGKRIYIENLEKRTAFRKNKTDNEIDIDENNLIENNGKKIKKSVKEKSETNNEEVVESTKYVEYNTAEFVPTTIIHRKTMDYIEKYGDMEVGGVEYKVQIALYKYRKNYTFPKLKQFGIVDNVEIENGITRMTIGGTFKTLREAFELNKKVIMAGQKDAFVCVFYNGKRVYIENLEKKGVFVAK